MKKAQLLSIFTFTLFILCSSSISQTNTIKVRKPNSDIAIVFARQSNGYAKLENAIKSNFLHTTNKDYKVTGFSMIYATSGKMIQFRAKGNTLSAGMKETISKMKKGSSITFVNIIVEDLDGNKLKLPGSTIKLY